MVIGTPISSLEPISSTEADAAEFLSGEIYKFDKTNG